MDKSGYDVNNNPIPFEKAVQLLQRLISPQDISVKVSGCSENEMQIHVLGFQVGAQVMLIQVYKIISPLDIRALFDFSVTEYCARPIGPYKGD